MSCEQPSRIRALDVSLRHFEARAAEAESWLLRIHDEIQDQFAPMAQDARH